MIATLTFNLPEDREEYELAVNGSKYYCAASDFSNYLRHKLKYIELEEREQVIFEEVRKKFYECFEGVEII